MSHACKLKQLGVAGLNGPHICRWLPLDRCSNRGADQKYGCLETGSQVEYLAVSCRLLSLKQQCLSSSSSSMLIYDPEAAAFITSK